MGEPKPKPIIFAGRQKQSTPGVARGVHRRYALGSLGLHAAMARVGWHRWATKARREHPLPRKPGAWETRMRERMARRTA